MTELSRLSSPSCDGCQRYIDLYRDTYAKGGYFKGGDWKIGELKLSQSPDETFVTTGVESGGGNYRAKRDAPDATTGVERTEVTFAVARIGGSALISQLVLGGTQ